MSALKKYSKFKSKCAYINYSKSYYTCAFQNVSAYKKQLKCLCIQFKVGIQALTIWARRALHSALLLSPAEVLVLLVLLVLKVLLLHLLVLKWDLFTNPLSLYGRRVHGWSYRHAMTKTCQNVGTLVKCRRPMQNVGVCRHFDPFSENFRRPLGADCLAPRNLIKEL